MEPGNLVRITSPVETLSSLNDSISAITLFVKEMYPEHYRFLDEMPDTLPNCIKPEISLKSLGAYYNSLLALVEHYPIHGKVST